MPIRISNADDDMDHLYDYTGSPGNGLPIYEGIAQPGTPTNRAAWKVKKYTYDSSTPPQAIKIQFAVITPLNTAIYDNRASLTYGSGG